MGAKKRALIVVLLAAAAVREAAAQPVRVGEEFLVNTYTMESQIRVAAGGDGAGNFVVVWESYPDQDGDGVGIFGQRYSSSGAPVGTEFQANSYTVGYQNVPAVCHSDNGIAVAWTSRDGQDGGSYGIFARRFSTSGAATGAEFQVNSYTLGTQDYPAVACRSDGSFVVAWQSRDQDGVDNGIFAQRYASSGDPAGSEFQINEFSMDNQEIAHLCLHGDGALVAAWTREFPDESIDARRFDSTGSALGGQFEVASGGLPYRHHFGLDCHDGGFIIAWSQDLFVGSDFDVFARRYDTAGAPIGSAFQVNSYTHDLQGYAIGTPGVLVASGSAGDFVVVWSDFAQDGSFTPSVFGQRFDSAGARSGTEFQVNSYTEDNQSGYYNGLAVAAAANGDFVVAWGSGGSQDGDNYGIFAQRFAAGNVTVDPVPTCPAAPLNTCREPVEAKASLLLMRDRSDPFDKVLWRWSKGSATDLSDFGNPLTTTSYAFCLYDETAGTPSVLLNAGAAAASTTCGGGPCWRSLGARGFKYKDKAKSSNGLAVLTLKAGVAGKAKVVVQLEGDDIPMPALPPAQDTEVTAQLLGSNGECWSATYSGPAFVAETQKFKDRND